MAEVKRIGIYIDGNNLFYGALKCDERRKYRWLNPERLVREVCDNYFAKNKVHFFLKVSSFVLPYTEAFLYLFSQR